MQHHALGFFSDVVGHHFMSFQQVPNVQDHSTTPTSATSATNKVHWLIWDGTQDSFLVDGSI